MASLRDALVGLTLRAEMRAQSALTRRFFTSFASLLRGAPDQAADTINGVGDLMAWADATSASWVTAGALDKGGDFDAADLRVWLELAERAGVPFVPARTILTLSEEELGTLSGTVQVPGFIANAIQRGIKTLTGRATSDAEGPAADDHAQPTAPSDATKPSPRDRASLVESLYTAMDDVPDGWMVRSHICGPSTLKALAGSGLMADADDTVAASADFAVGPGWVRHGNRRCVDATNARYVELFPQGHGPTIAYLARPWVDADRRMVGPDPHRHGTPFAGKGSWPCEWRVFVEQGRVTGVAAYYAWTGKATPMNAKMALQAAEMAQRIVNEAARLSLRPVMMDILIAQRHQDAGVDLHPTIVEAITRFGSGVSGTLDFIEAEGGLMLLEGGPGHTPIGGGHPCAFAGVGRTGPGTMCRVEGVALRLMDHIILADHKTWVDGDHTGCILTWDQARALAAS